MSGSNVGASATGSRVDASARADGPEKAVRGAGADVRGVEGRSRPFAFTVVAKIVPAVRMTQRSKFVSRQAGRYLTYKDRIGWAAKMAGAELMSGPITLLVTAYVHDRKWDASNVLKGVEDALNGVCWEDDYAIVDARIRVFDCSGKNTDVLDVEVIGGKDGD